MGYETIEFYTLLEAAAEQGRLECVKDLLPRSTFDEGCRALRAAVAYNQYDVVEYLINCVDFECSIGQIAHEYMHLRENDRPMFNLLYRVGGRESINLLDTYLIPGKYFPMLREWANEEDAQYLLDTLPPGCVHTLRKM